MEELAEITNHRAGLCMCGRDEGVQYGPHPFGYGNCCVHCQREWERKHGGARWESEASRRARLAVETARAKADGRDPSKITRAWNQGLPPFHRPRETYAGLSDEWKTDYESWRTKLEQLEP